MAATGGLHHPMNRVAEARCAIIGIERDWETGKVTFLTTEYAESVLETHPLMQPE